MRDNITLLVKRAKTYLNDDGTIIEGIGDLILEYGELLYLEDLNCIVVGEGRLYETEAEAQEHTTRTYWDSIKYIESKLLWLGGPIVKELVADKEYFSKSTNIKLYNDSTFEKEISLSSNSTLIAKTQFVQSLTDKKISDAIANLTSSVEGQPFSTSKTITNLYETNGKVFAKLEPISITYDQITTGTKNALPLPATEKPLSANPTAQVGTSTKYAREDHVHPMSDGGSTRKPVYISNGNAYPVGDVIDVSITGNAATANKLTVDGGTSEKPIYFKNGVPTQCDDTLNVNVKGNSATATKVGTSTVGSSEKPIYLNAGVATQCSGTLDVSVRGSSTSCTGTSAYAKQFITSLNAGASNKPVYIKNGVPTQCDTTLNSNVSGNANTSTYIISSTTTVGASNTPVYVLNGKPTKCGGTLNVSINGSASSAGTATTASKLGTSTIGSSTKPIYLNAGVATACGGTLDVNISGTAGTASKLGTSNVGSTTTPIYLSGGKATACGGTLAVSINGSANTATTATKIGSSTIGAYNIPVYINAGTPTKCTSPLAMDISGKAGTVSSTSGNSFYIAGVKTANGQLYYNTSVTVSSSNVLMGAAWNDFAEFRLTGGEPGDTVCETGDGRLEICDERLKPGAYIVSDTYGMIIGPQKEGYKGVAVAGRVLAKYFGNKLDFVPGMPVCAGPCGLIYPMSRFEIKEFPESIVGYVSEIPTYEEWNGVKVNNRIWIKVK